MTAAAAQIDQITIGGGGECQQKSPGGQIAPISERLHQTNAARLVVVRLLAGRQQQGQVEDGQVEVGEDSK